MKTQIALSALALVLGACASSQTAKQFHYIDYEDKPTAQRKSIGTIEGKDCSWSVLGYSLGAPTARAAFQNAALQRDAGFIPGQTQETQKPALKALRNATVEDSGFNAWVVGRSCIVVTGEGYL